MKKLLEYGRFFVLLDHFLDLFESKWLYEYIIRRNKIYMIEGRNKIYKIEQTL